MTAGGAGMESPASGQGEPADAMVLKVGDMVKLCGLKAAPELNGVEGQLCKFDSIVGRWEVKLSDGEMKALKPVNLEWRSMGPIDDDGTLMLASMASDHPVVQNFTQVLGMELPKVRETISLTNAVIGPTGGGAATGADAEIWAKLAVQAEKRVRGALEDVQTHLEALDSVDTAACTSAKAADELRMARKDLVLLAQAIQERLEIALGRLQPVFKKLKAEAPRKRHGWDPDPRQEASLHEKYREAFAPDGTAQADAAVALKPIVVKYQGYGEKPAPSDNLYIKGLPRWISEEDMQAMFSRHGEIKSMKLKTNDWGAIAFVRLASKKEAALTIQSLDGTIPERLKKRAEEQDDQSRKNGDREAELRAVVDQLDRGVLLVFDLAETLGLLFAGDGLFVERVQAASQAEGLGVRKGWQVRSIGGIKVKNAQELEKKVLKLKSKGLKEAAIAFSPPPVILTFRARPFGLAVAKQEGRLVVQDATGTAYEYGVRPGAILTMVEGTNVSGFGEEEAMDMLRHAVLPAEVAFEQSQGPRGGDGRPIVAASVPKVMLDLSDSSEDEERGTANTTEKLVVDLTQPLGVHFDSSLRVKAVQEASQAASFGVVAGWRARSIGGLQLHSTEQLVDRIKALKVQGEKKVGIVFDRGSAQQSRAAAGARRKTLQMDLSQPLGIKFDRALRVDLVSDGSQAARFGVAKGWRARTLAGHALQDTPDLVARIKTLKANGSATAEVGFVLDAASVPAEVHDAESVPAEDAQPKDIAQPAGPQAAAGAGDAPAVDAASGDGMRELIIDLSKPLGMRLDADLVVEGVQEGSQAEELKIGEKWRVVAIAGQALTNTAELLTTIEALHAHAVQSVALSFCPAAPIPAPKEEADVAAGERPAKRAKTEQLAGAAAGGSNGDTSESGAQRCYNLVMDLSKPLGIHFDDKLRAKGVQAGSQAAALGIDKGWSVQAVLQGGADTLASTPELVAVVKRLKLEGQATASFTFMPAPPTVATFTERPLGFTVTSSTALQAFVVTPDSSDSGPLAGSAVRSGSVLVSMGDRDLSNMNLEELKTLLAEASLPLTMGFQEAPRFSASMNLGQPLGITFDKQLRAKEVMEGTQAATLGIRRGWQVHTIDGKALCATPELVAAIKQLKQQQVDSVTMEFFPTGSE